MIAMRSINLILITAALSLSVPRSAESQDATSARAILQIEVSATGTATRDPDHAQLTIAVSTDRASAAEAAAMNAQIQQQVLDTLASMGYSADEISTTRFTVDLASEYQYKDPSHPPMYRARNQVRVVIADLTQIGSTIDAALAAGATHIADVDLLSADAAQASREALADAAAKARVDAEVLARSMGGQLGNLIWITTESRGIVTELTTTQGFITTSTPIKTGELSYSAHVTARWRFVPHP
jgi:uncharacterized protein YggE